MKDLNNPTTHLVKRYTWLEKKKEKKSRRFWVKGESERGSMLWYRSGDFVLFNVCACVIVFTVECVCVWLCVLGKMYMCMRCVRVSVCMCEWGGPRTAEQSRRKTGDSVTRISDLNKEISEAME